MNMFTEEINKRIDKLLSNPELAKNKLEKLHNYIINHKEYENAIDADTRFKFQFVCMCYYWDIRDNIIYSLYIFNILRKYKPIVNCS